MTPLTPLQGAQAEKFCADLEYLIAGTDPVRAGVLLARPRCTWPR